MRATSKPLILACSANPDFSKKHMSDGEQSAVNAGSFIRNMLKYGLQTGKHKCSAYLIEKTRMFGKFIIGLAISCVGATALGQATPGIRAPKSGAYATDNNGTVMRSGDGLCWRTGSWDPSKSAAGCDGELTPPIAKPTAPAIVANPVPAVIEAPAATASTQCDFTITLEGDQTFTFNEAKLTASAENRINNDVLPKFDTCSTIDAILVTGYTDRLGTAKYNKKLSAARAAVVASYLKNNGISTAIETRGAGEAQPIKICGGKLSQRQLIVCLAPNRRVVIEVRGKSR